MRKQLLTIAAATGFMATAALAESPLQVFFENTVRADENGHVVEFYINEDGTAATVDGHQATWSATETEFCIDAGAEKLCWANDTRTFKVGDTWENTTTDGRTATYTLIAGRK